MPDVLDLFHPLVADWFRATLGAPTDVQRLAWPRIANGEHLLVTAPTGSGKTLTAFLWSIDRFLRGDLATGHTRVLYVSPLKALNNDIERNLTTPLAQLERRFTEAGSDFPRIRVATRSGDTDATDRRQLVRRPPEILITTPESLNLLLSSRSGRTILGGLHTVILDEIHSLVDSKRGAYLLSAVERLTLLSGEFQRLALSATVNPLARVAELVGGHVLVAAPGEDIEGARYERRPVSIVHSAADKRYEVTIRYPEASAQRPAGEKIWESLGKDFTERIASNRSTLLFTNSRVLCEKLTHKINQAAGELLAYSHHGSLSREIRTAVEGKLKAGELKAIVATSSLEMGIDIGDLDEVLLVQSPGSISSAIQRVGRAGHRVGEISRGTLYPTHPQDFLESAVLGKALREGDIEPRLPVDCPLDVLAQVIVSMVAMEPWHLDQLYLRLRCCESFHRLSRARFDLVIEMLGGRYAETRIQELKPRISIDRIDGTVEARPGALLALYLSGGVIPDRGYYQLRHAESDARIGELDEEFVWEARPGQIFTLGTQQWQIQRITHSDVRVLPARASSSLPPFWKAESLDRDFHFSERIGGFLEAVEACADDEAAARELLADLHMDERAARALLSYLREQRAHCRCPLPHRHHVLVERTQTAPGNSTGNQIILHTLWGNRVNRPFALALEAAFDERFGTRLEVFVTNDCLVLQLPPDIGAAELFALVPPARIEELIRRSLEGSAFFAARFRECAGRALLLSKRRFNERKPLWMSRLQAQKLMDAVTRYEDFPMLLETWRACMQDEFDLPALHRVLDEIGSGVIRVSDVTSAVPSPMAQNLSWSQINVYMYQEDQAPGQHSSNLRRDLLEELLRTPELRPAIPAHLVAEFERKRKRLIAGYGPQSARELLDWLDERVAMPWLEWRELLAGMEREHGEQWVQERLKEADTRIVHLRGTADLVLPLAGVAAFLQGCLDGRREGIVLETLEGAPLAADLRSVTDDPVNTGAAVQLGNWLQSCGPLTPDEMTRVLGIADTTLAAALADLLQEGAIISGPLVQGRDETMVCDAGNLEILLRMLRQQSRPQMKPIELAALPLLLHAYQAEAIAEADVSAQVARAIESLRCYPAPAALWEAELLPARVRGYTPQLLDALFQDGSILWLGRGHQQVSLCLPEDLDLLAVAVPDPALGAAIRRLLPDPLGRYDFGGIMSRSDRPSSEIAATLWQLAFAGHVTNDTFAALRQGIDTDFTPPDMDRLLREPRHGGRIVPRRGGLQRWRSALPFGGNWYQLPHGAEVEDPVEQEEIQRERVRILLDRYGILFREMLGREDPHFRWNALLRSLRLMEMSGEVLSGHFVEGIPGPQFISQRMYGVLQGTLSRDTIFWINAADPLSLCGIALTAMKGTLPRRLASNHLVYRGHEPVLVVRRSGADLAFHCPPDDPDLPEIVGVLQHMLQRSRTPQRQVRIEQINGRPAPRSPFVAALRAAFDTVVDHRQVTLHRSL